MSSSIDARHSFTRRSLGAVSAVVVLASIAGFAGGRTTTPVAAQVEAPIVQNQPQRVAGMQSSYGGVVRQVAPAVVTVRVESSASAARPTLPDGFAPRRGGGRESLGSGVVIRADGYVLTNHHVVAGADRVQVELADRRSFEAAVVGSDAASDLAVLKIEARGLTTLPFGDSEQVQVGDVVLALGNPLGLGQTVTMGIVSAKGRATGLGDGSYEDFIQTDAPINQGNSGGALVSVQGELIGINSQILSPSGGNIGVAFAIPSTMARAISDQLIQDGVVHRSKLGVTVQPMTADLAASLGLSEVRGALVSAVEAGSPADQAGVRQGDVIASFQGRPVLDANAVRNQVATTKPGSIVSFNLLRNGREEAISARLVERESGHEKSPRPPQLSSSPNPALGVTVQPLTATFAVRIGLPQTMTGLLITDVDGGSAAAEAGLQPGDVITQINGKEIQSVSDLRAAITLRPDRPSLVLVIREGASLFLALKPGV